MTQVRSERVATYRSTSETVVEGRLYAPMQASDDRYLQTAKILAFLLYLRESTIIEGREMGVQKT